MTWIKNATSTVLLLCSIVLIVLSTLFYNVSAVKIYDEHQRELFMSTLEGLHGYSQCEWVSSVFIIEKVITLKCKTPAYGIRVLHVNVKYQVISSLDPSDIKLSEASAAFTALNTSSSFTISTTNYKNENVYWVVSDEEEWLLNFDDYSILWKVDKNYE
jgi:hypothetical protein